MMNRIESPAALKAAQAKYQAALAAETRRVLICTGTGCLASGGLKIYEALQRKLNAMGIPCEVQLDGEHEGETVGVRKTGCHGLCEFGPMLRIEPENWVYIRVREEDVDEIVERTLQGGEFIDRLGYRQGGQICRAHDDIPFYQKQTRRVLEHCDKIDAESLEDYLAMGGYSAVSKALFEMSSDEIIQAITDSGIRGRGGAGFPMGKKWAQVAAHDDPVKYIVCNGDEGDPGAFMDRSCMEDDPHRLLEGMIVAGIATGATEGYIYVRAEYPTAVSRLTKAIEQAEAAGLLGDDILGSGKSFHIHINCGAGAFVCGEGSALTASIEGNRGMPRTKPPRTVDKGLFEKPTCLNNVETLASVSGIIENGAAWYRSLGTEGSSGTKAFALAGNVVNTGLIEVPMGITLREVVYDIGGGIKNGKAFKAVQIGGPSGGCLTPEHMDISLDFDSLKKVGAIIGSGGLVVMDEDACMVNIAQFFMNFICEESCGKCTPCREGTTRMNEILSRITNGNGRMGDIQELKELAQMIQVSSLCGLGKTAPNPVLSTLQNFEDEYVEHIRDKHCRCGVCKELMRFVITDKCIGCTKCARNCPVGAITGSVRQKHSIDSTVCIKCGVCKANCPVGAIKEG